MNDFGCCETRVDYKEKWKEVHVLQVEKDDLKGRVERDFKEKIEGKPQSCGFTSILFECP